jgi:CHAD domain-containing protein
MPSRRHTVATLAGDTSPLLHERVAALYRRLPGGIAGDEEDLHEMRVAARRLRVALTLLPRRSRGRRVRRARETLRSLVRAGGCGRDLDVMLSLLEERLQEGEPPEQLARLRRSLRGSHTRSRGATASALMDVDIAGLRRDLRAIAGRPGESVFAAMARIREERDALGEELITATLDLGTGFDAVRLHWMRRRLRRLRYAAELQAQLQGRRLAASRQLKKLQSLLGAVNDAWVLRGWLEGREIAAQRRADDELAAQARGLRAWALARSRDRHRAWLDSDPAAVLRRALTSMGSRWASVPAFPAGRPGSTA